MVLSFGSPIGNEITRGKLTLLREFLTRNGLESSRSGDGVGQSIFLAEALFARAPNEYIEQSSVEDLAQSVGDALKFYQEFLASDSAYALRIDEINRPGRGRCTTILTAMDDRPFIVDTLNELLRVLQLRCRALLHPILKHDNGRVTSLTYFELDPIDDPQLISQIRTEIEWRFNCLQLVTDDFQIISKHNQEVSSLLLQAATNGAGAESDKQEIGHFLQWLADGNFLFLGFKEWIVDDKAAISASSSECFGLFRSSHRRTASSLLDVENHIELHARETSIFRYSKLVAESPVHRYGRMDLITLRVPGSNPGAQRYVALIGLLTSKGLAQEASSIPMIRRKLQRILELEGLPANSHDYKETISIIDSMPKSELLQCDVEVLRRDISMIFGIQGRSQVKIRYSLDAIKHLISVLIVMPRERYFPGSRMRILQAIETRFRSQHASSEVRMTTTDNPLYMLHILIPNPGSEELKVNTTELEQAVLNIVLTWEDKLYAEASRRTENVLDQRELEYYAALLPDFYKASVPQAEAYQDILALDNLTAEHPLELSIEQAADDPLYDLKLYKVGDDLTMSAILPFLENCGFSIVSETLTPVRQHNETNAAIYKLRVRPRHGNSFDLKLARQVLLPGLTKVISGHADNDRLNELMLFPGLDLREVAILRLLTRYLWQIRAITSEQSCIAALVENSAATGKLVELFVLKFNPKSGIDDLTLRQAKFLELRDEFLTELKNVSQLTHDRVLRRVLNVIEAAVRTNFFCSSDPMRLSLKIDCAKVERMPDPRPMFEIFVVAPDLEGVHLRGGKVARGGLRWSDREDDFRTEVLGLMKTQMIKNSIIIPVGAKGGFVLKNRPSSAADLPAAVKATYKRFIRSLLEVTDNRVLGKVVHPVNCVVYDEEDPYFVVAADRGTATFSDVANEIAVNEFHFWLGDAFASGGSNGYDHKKLAITARGVWEAVCRHFREIGVDPEHQEFTAVGIGDMSGDVFGNGMLLSKKTRVVAAFDHRHIFIDPTPDSASSFEERKRLFELPQSKWSDYDSKLISKGGGIFLRSEKEITLSPEAQAALGTSSPSLSGQELVKTILRAPVDLLWNGGIGTYVKSAEEDNNIVGDRTNDEVRVDARELRVKVVGEGGNLGFTQLARIEYSKIGGHINTDAVDNSGGVNLSDLEVNLKILLSAPVARGDLKSDERNSLLTSLSTDVCQKVLRRNRSQTRALSLGVRRSRKHLSAVRSLIGNLAKEKFVDRRAEHLPSDETIAHRMQLKAGLTRPELAILVGSTKMSLFKTLIESSVPDDPFLAPFLFDYFPRAVIDRFSPDIPEHPLQREIIATEVANMLVERFGASFVYRSSEELGVSRTTVINAALAANAIIGANTLTDKLEILDKPNGTRQHLLVLIRLTAALEHMTRWLLDHRHDQLSLTDVVQRYKESFRLLVAEADRLNTQLERARFRESSKQLIMNGVPPDLAHSLSSLTYGAVYLDIIEISILTAAPVLEVAKLFADLYLMLHIRPLLEQVSDIEATDRWEESAIRMLAADARRAIAKLAQAIIQTRGGSSAVEVESFLESKQDIIARYQETYHEFSGRQLTVPALLMLTNQLFSLSRV